jgi:hypothetical protein
MSYLTRLCTRQDLRAVVAQYNRWSVDEQGNLVGQTEAGDPDGDAEEYVCDNCGLYFTPDGGSRGAFELAWEEALAHLPNHHKVEALA